MFQVICSLLISCSPALADDACSDSELHAGDGRAGAFFGGSVALSEDTLLVGAEGDDDLGPSAGAAYLYSLEGGQWVEAQKLHADDGMAGDGFGERVSLEGEVALVGARNHDPFGGSENAEAVYVFRREGPTWVQEAKLLPDAATSVLFGQSISLSGDVALIGAPADQERGEQAGAAYVFRYVDEAWTREAKLFSNDTPHRDYFGGSVSISGNLAVIGASGAKERGRYGAGAAFVFRFDNGRWIQVAKLLPDRGKLFSQFGRATAISGETVFVIAITRGGKGVITAFGPVGPKWRQLEELPRDHRDSLGTQLAVAGDTLLAGAPLGSRGRVSVFRFDGLGWRAAVSPWPPDGEVGDHFGYDVAVWGDMALVGAPGHDDFGSDSGAAYVFDLNCPRGCDRFPRPRCDGDVDGNGEVDLVDVEVTRVLVGSTWEHTLCRYDLDCDGQINAVDVGIVMSLMGTCDPPRPPCPQDEH